MNPTLFEWAGGAEAIERLTAAFYRRVLEDDLLGPLFEKMAPRHAHHVAQFIEEVLGGPKNYSAERGGHSEMIRHHLGRNLIEPQRRRFVELLLDAADEAKLPDDPEFRSALVAYLEWGSRLAVLNSKPGVEADPQSPMPVWSWGVPGGPYQPPPG